MKKIVTLIIIILVWFNITNAQNPTAEKGLKYFESFDFYKTIEKLESLQDKTPTIINALAYSYYNTKQYDKAEEYFSKIANTPNVNKEIIYTYVKVLLINKKYQDAETWMQKFSQLAPNDERGKLYAAKPGFWQVLSKDNGYWTIKDLDFNSISQDYSPTFFKNQVVFSGNRSSLVEPIKRIWNWNDKPFDDFYLATLDSNSLEFSSIKKFDFNKKYHEGTASFANNGTFIMFTSDNYSEKSDDGSINLMMFESTFEKGKWKDVKPFEYNNPNFSVGHPSLSPDGKVLYFASDMPGGIGGVDLYVCFRQNDGTWTKPQNLGNSINTESNEMFPFFSQKGFLFFASDGRPGIGGLDLYVAKVDDFTNFSNVQNLTATVNSNFDDFGIVFDDSLKNGYFCSNRPNGKGDDDIYSFNLLVPFFENANLEVLAVDNDNNILTNTLVQIIDEQNNVIDTAQSDYLGFCKFEIARNRNFIVGGTKIKYLPDTNHIGTFADSTTFHTTLVLNPQPFFSLIGKVCDDKTKEPIDSCLVILVAITDSIRSVYGTDDIGKFRSYLNYVKLNDKIKYSISIAKKGYLPYKSEFSLTFDHTGEYNINDLLKIELHKLNIGDDIARALNVKPIYFDLGKYNIRPDAAIELDKIVKVMNDYPTLEIELGSHTDSRGSDASNLTLSQHRAISSADYIKQRITNPDRITGKGYGETTPKVIDEDIHAKYDFLPVGQPLTEKFILTLKTTKQKEAAFQLNRRTEFKIIKY